MDASPDVDLRTLVKLALSQKVSWSSLKIFLHDLTSTFESSQELNVVLLEELQLLHSKTILDQTKVNISEKGIQTSQDVDTGTENDVVMIRLFPKQENFEEANSQEVQLQEQNPLDLIDMKFHQPEQSIVEEDLADNLQNDTDMVDKNVAEKDSIEESTQIETTEEEAFQPDQNPPKNEIITDSRANADEFETDYYDEGNLIDEITSPETEKDNQNESNSVHGNRSLEETENESLNHSSSRMNKENKKESKRILGKEKNFECGQCNKRFSNKTVLQIHERIHTGAKPYQCLSCKKSFSQRHNLKYHKRIHTGEKPYQCLTCKKTFSHSYNLKLHQRIHTGEKPYECEKCYKKFKSKSNLNQHILRSNEC